MGAIKLPHSSGNSMSIAAPASNPSGHLEIKVPATIGSAKQVLRNSSTAGTLEFGTPYGELIHNASSNSTVSNITHDSLDTDKYKAWHVIGHFLPITDNVALNFYFRNGGSDCVADEYSIGQMWSYPNDDHLSNAANLQGRMQLCGEGGNATREGWRINLFIFPDRNGDATNQMNCCFWQATWRNQDHSYRAAAAAGDYDTDVYPDGFKLQAHSGQIGEYSYALYGLLR